MEEFRASVGKLSDGQVAPRGKADNWNVIGTSLRGAKRYIPSRCDISVAVVNQLASPILKRDGGDYRVQCSHDTSVYSNILESQLSQR